VSESAPRGGASIDDLLRFEEEPAGRPEARRGGWLRWLLRTVLVTGAATAVLVAGLRAIGFTVSLPVLVAGVLALLGDPDGHRPARAAAVAPGHVGDRCGRTTVRRGRAAGRR
jgi:hypothetical protein